MVTGDLARNAVPQEIRFCQSADGVRLAHTKHGSGPPLVIVSCWLSHLQHDWQSPVWRHFLEDLGAFTTLVRYDLRGHGLSDWTVDDFSLEAQLSDLDAVVQAQGLDRFGLLGMSGNSMVALAYAQRHPERVTRLVVYGGWAGWPRDETAQNRLDEAAWQAMVRAGWARPDPTFRRVFTQTFIPDATEAQMRWFDDLQRMSTSARNVIAARVARRRINVAGDLASVRAPTLVLHALHDRAIEFEFAREVATRIPDARLVPLESNNHILLADEAAWDVFVTEVRGFMRPEQDALLDGEGVLTAIQLLSPRELEILRLAATGMENVAIADALVLSLRTIERHMSNAYLKLGVHGPAARTAAVARLLRSHHA